MMGGETSQVQVQPGQLAQGKQSCLHFEQGHCKFGNTCFKEHDPAKYNTRPRSNSAGAMSGFQRPPKFNLGALGGIQEQPSPGSPQLPVMQMPMFGAAEAQLEMQRMDGAAKKFQTQEEMMQNQLKETAVAEMMKGNYTLMSELLKVWAPSKNDA